MKRYSLVFAGVILGCAGTIAVPVMERALAQPYGANRDAPRWEQRCQIMGGYPRGDAREPMMERVNAALRAAGEDGWELVAVPAPVTGSNQVWSELLLCFKRPGAG